MKLKPQRNLRPTIQEQKINVELLWDRTIEELYKKKNSGKNRDEPYNRKG